MKKIGILIVILCLVLCSGCDKDGMLNLYKKANETTGDMVN